MKLQAREGLRSPRLQDLAALDDAAFRALFSKSPVKRIGRDRFVRNVLYAIGNSGDPALAASALRLLDDPAPVVRGAAAWALGRLDPLRWAAERDRRSKLEADEDVRAEWGLPSPPPLRRGGDREPCLSPRSGGAVSARRGRGPRSGG